MPLHINALIKKLMCRMLIGKTINIFFNGESKKLMDSIANILYKLFIHILKAYKCL